MADPRDQPAFSEKTQPFSQSEIEARLASSRMEFTNALSSTVPLDKLVVPPDEDIRILMRPLTRDRSVSPGNHETCRWLALHAEVAEKDQSQHKVLAVTQTSRDIKFSVRIPEERVDDVPPRPPLWCELYYDPASDNQILLNRSDVPFTLSRVSQSENGSAERYEVRPNFNKALAPGTWRISVGESDVLDFRVLEKRPALLRLPSCSSSSDASSLSEMMNSAGKRSFVADEDDPLSPGKRLRPSEPDKDGDGVIMFLPAKTNPLVFPLPTSKGKELATANGHPLLDMEPDETVEVRGGCEIDEYAITKKGPIASTSLSSVFTADHSKIPDGVIVVKVLKTRSPATANNEGAQSRNVIHQADIWLRELQYQENLEHKSIVRLYGGDARYLSLYMEHVDAQDLSSKNMWRNPSTDLFSGTRSDAVRILRDIASALHYIHGKGLVHNDIKPGNILYSPERGAVLCDLGLSTHARHPASTGGTPWYVPPEYIALKQRGAPSDVWALGVTMLYVLRKITFPDVRGHRAHPRHIHWLIAKVHSRDPRPKDDAIGQMQRWLREVNTARSALDRRDKLEAVIYDMLALNPTYRLRTQDIVNQLYTEPAAGGR